MKNTRKLMAFIFAMIMMLAVGCQNAAPATDSKPADTSSAAPAGDSKASGELKTIEDLTVQFVPSRDPAEIMTQTAPLGDLLKKYLKEEGYDVKKVTISVGTTYEATGEALSAGSIDVGLIPGGTYVLYDDGAEVILTATRKGLSNDSENPKDWNDNKPTVQSDKEVSYYRAMILAGPSPKGQELAAKVNKGEKLTWEDLNSAKWGVRSISSSSGYIYPYLWLQKNYGKGITDLANVVEQESYNTAIAQLATGQLDIVVGFTDMRMDNIDKWVKEYNGPKDIWEDTNVLGISDPIYNDTISVAKNSQSGNITPEFKVALQNAFINLAKTPEGKEVIKIYNHDGYVQAKPEDYAKEKEAQKLMKSLNR